MKTERPEDTVLPTTERKVSLSSDLGKNRSIYVPRSSLLMVTTWSFDCLMKP